MEEITAIPLGTIKLNKKVIAGDPCYSANSMSIIKNALPGIYHAYIRKAGRVSRLITIHEKYINNIAIGAESLGELDSFLRSKNLYYFEDTIGVDSGQAGIYDYDYFRKNEKQRDYNDTTSWYRRVCELKTQNTHAGTMDSRCAVSQSGWGDGEYALSVYRKQDTMEAVAFVIDYGIENYDEENYNEEE